MQRHFWRESYFNDLLKRLETNSDVDPTIVEIDKAKYQRMLKGDQSKQIAGRSVNEILTRFNNKIKDPRRAKKGRNVAKIVKICLVFRSLLSSCIILFKNIDKIAHSTLAEILLFM